MVPSNNIKNHQQPKNSCKPADIRQFFQFTCVQLCLWRVNILSRGAQLCFIHCTKQTVPLEEIIINPIIIILQVLYQTEFSFIFHQPLWMQSYVIYQIKFENCKKERVKFKLNYLSTTPFHLMICENIPFSKMFSLYMPTGTAYWYGRLRFQSGPTKNKTYNSKVQGQGLIIPWLDRPPVPWS